MPYADASAQTVWAGLTKSNVGPEMLFTAPDTTTPPAEMITEKSQIFIDPQTATTNPIATTTSLLGRRKNRPDFPTRISLPKSGLDDEVLPSPPPTQALLSPLPEANKRYAGHTPLIPRALSPEPPEEEREQAAEEPVVEEDKTATPDVDEGLTGPLILPTNPIDGADDHIALDVLDHVLEKVAKDQDRFSKLKDAPEPAGAPAPAPVPAADVEEEVPLSRKGSADSRQSAATEFVDGVRLKSPPLNFGAPYGQLSFAPPAPPEQT